MCKYETICSLYCSTLCLRRKHKYCCWQILRFNHFFLALGTFRFVFLYFFMQLYIQGSWLMLCNVFGLLLAWLYYIIRVLRSHKVILVNAFLPVSIRSIVDIISIWHIFYSPVANICYFVSWSYIYYTFNHKLLWCMQY